MKCLVGFSYHDSFISKLIATKLGRNYSHVFMLFECQNEYIVLHATRKGISALSWDTFQSKNKIIKMVEMTDEAKVSKAFHYCVSKLGITYGYLAILAIALGIHYQDGEKTMICSEYIANALDLKFDKIQDLITPVDIEDSL